MGGVAAVGSAAKAARAPSSKTSPVFIPYTLPARRPQPSTVLDGNTADGWEREVKSHQVHVVGNGALHELAAGDQGAVAGEVETVVPGRLLQVERVDGGIAEVEQLLAFGGNEDGEMAWRVTGGGNGEHAGHNFSFAVVFAVDGLDLVAQRAKA